MDSNPDLCDDHAVFQQLTHQTNWKLVMWVNHKPEDDGYRSTVYIDI